MWASPLSAPKLRRLTLSRRELDAVAARLSVETGLPHMKPAAGEHVAGVYRQGRRQHRMELQSETGVGIVVYACEAPGEPDLRITEGADRRSDSQLRLSFVQAPFFFDDLTQASTKATPSTPSCTVG